MAADLKELEPVSAADLGIVAEIHDVLRRGLTNRGRVASALVNYAFEIVADDPVGQICLLQQILEHNRKL
jgi:hypothetical protein